MFSVFAQRAAFATLSFFFCLNTAAAQTMPTEAPPPPVETPAPASETPAPAAEPPAPIVTPAAPAPVVEPPPPPLQAAIPDPPRAPRREWGVGTIGGAGFAGLFSESSAKGGKPALAFLLPTLEIRIFNDRGRSMDISLPLLNLIVVSALSRSFVFNADLYYNFNFGSGSTRFLIGPGFGYAMAAGRGVSAYGLRGLGQIGVEFLTPKRGFGFQVTARPWMEFAIIKADSSLGTDFGGGMLFNVGMVFYKTT